MNKEKLIETLEKTLQSMREALEKNEGSMFQAVGSAIKLSYEGFKAHLDHNDTAQTLIGDMKNTLGDFESALKDGDRQLSSSLIKKAEALLAEYKTKN